MFYKLLCILALFVSYTNQATPDAPKCTLALSESIAGSMAVGAQYSDYPALSEIIKTNQLRLSKIDLCQGTQVPLVGMSGRITLIDPLTDARNGTFDLQKVGRTDLCESLFLDLSKGEFVKNMTIDYDSNRVQYIYITTNLNNTLSKGRTSSSMERKELLFDEKNQMVGLWGSESSNTIYSVGSINLLSNCWPVDVPRPAFDTEAIIKLINLGYGEIIVIVLVCLLVLLSIPLCYCAYKCLKDPKHVGQVVPDTARVEDEGDADIIPENKSFDLLANTEGNDVDYVVSVDNNTDVELQVKK